MTLYARAAHLAVVVLVASTLSWGCSGHASDVVSDVVDLGHLPRPGGGEPSGAAQTSEVLHQYADEHPDVYAGRVLAGGRVYVGFTRDAAANLAAVRRRLMNPATVRAFRARRTYGDLAALQARIAADRPSLQAQGIDVCFTFVDEQHNNVQIVLPRATLAATRALHARYGSGAAVITQRCPKPVG
jgi:hypothetical protein